MIKLKKLAKIGFLFAALTVGGSILHANDDVLRLKPVGYWPANEGKGDVVHDLSTNANHAKMVHVPWDADRKLVNFTGAYQWLEVPANKAYQTRNFSMGGWVFIRSEVIGSGWVNRLGFTLIGNFRCWLHPVSINVRRQELIDVQMDNKGDVLGTWLYASRKDGKRVERGYGKPSLPLGQWQHLIYTFEADKLTAAEKQLTEAPTSPNLALTAKVTASNNGGHWSRAPKNAIDGKLDTFWTIWPGFGPKPDSQEKWIQLDFGKPINVNRIKLIRRGSKGNVFLGGKLLFSDGSTINVSKFAGEDWDGLFATKKVTWIRFDSPKTRASRPALKEFEVYKEKDVTISPEEGVVSNYRLGNNIIGTGSLYLNGQLIASKNELTHTPSNLNLGIGHDAYWWHQMGDKSGSLDGSVRDMVWFDRALSAADVAHLCKITKPEVAPDVYDDSMIVLDGRAIGVKDLASLSPSDRRTVLLLYGRKNEAALQKISEALVPVAEAALNEADCRRVAGQLLLKMKSEATLRSASPKLVAVVADQARSKSERADAALALAAMGTSAAESVPALAATLDKLVPTDNVQPPRVEEILRNALIQALLEIDPSHKQAQEVLARTFAEPMMKAIDLKNPALAKETRAGALRSMIKDEKWLEAMALYSKMPPSVREYFFTYKAPKDRDYTATARFNGATYKVGTGIAWHGVEKVPVDEYKSIVSELNKKYPNAANWRNPEYEHLCRVPITKIGADGKAHKIYLEGKNFILDGADAKLRAWSIFIDELGYVHLMGGQHNYPNPTQYIPGSWERMGVSRNKKSDDYPLQMYWVSTKPESIDSFKFAGQRSNPQAIPATYLNYLCFVQSHNNNETYLYGRSQAYGWQCWGMFRYNAAKKRWTPVGGDVYDLIQSAKKNDPDWLNYLHGQLRGRVPVKPGDSRPLVWAWEPPFYNFCRDGWGVRFDKTGRMHVRMAISGLDGAGYVRLSSVYAWSDDRGDTFHRADGSPVKLPLTVNPAPEHNAEIDTGNKYQHHAGGQYKTRQWQELWLGLITKAGYRM